MTDVKIIKLVGGMELVAKIPAEQFENQTSPIITLQSPYYVVIQQSPGGQVGLAMQPFSLVGDISTVDIQAQHVLCVMNADERFAQSYLANLAGLVTADAGDVAPEGARSDRRGRLTLVD